MTASAAAVAAACAAWPCAAEPAFNLSADYVADVAGPVSGGQSRAGRLLDNLLVRGDLDLERAFGWSGASAHVSLLNNSGGRPNDLVGSLQGVDNIEVARPRGKIYEAWVEQDLGAVAVRAGLYDLNSEFYTTDSAGLLIGPAFGIGSELAATGPNGPSIFPSTALGLRLQADLAQGVYVQAAVIGANAGVGGDPDDFVQDFSHGALYIAEAGWSGAGKLAFGVWRYGQRQAAFNPSSPAQIAQGAYVLVDQPLRGVDGDVRAISGFLRLGVSDGETTPFSGGGQTGVMISRVFAGSPESRLSMGFSQGRLASDFRHGLRADGIAPAKAERAIELTYADTFGGRLTLQPSLQHVLDVGGDRHAKSATVVTLRVRIHLD
jgi:porin